MYNQNAEITLRQAVAVDVPFIARCVMAGIEMLHVEDELPERLQPLFDHLKAICLRDDTLYSYRNTIIAEVNGDVAGALVAYDGSRYASLRRTTFSMAKDGMGVSLDQNAMETSEGEYYLDSMAILPQFRGLGIGKMLMLRHIEYAECLGINKVTLLVDQHKPRLQVYYENLGFAFGEEVFVFGEWYNKLVKLDSSACPSPSAELPK